MAVGQNSINQASLYAPDLPWNRFKAEDLGPCIMNFVNDHEPFFRKWAEIWYENFQFLYGNSTVKWSKQYGFAVDYDFLRRDGPFQMRANTNLARVIAESLAAFIFGQLPEWEVDAMDESSIKGKRYRKIVQKILDAYMQRLCMETEFKSAAMIYTMFGQVGAVINWNKLAGQLLEIPRFQKTQSPVFSDILAPNMFTQGLIEVPNPIVDGNGQPLMEDRWQPILDQNGRQIIDKLFSGDVGVSMLTPFEYRREIGQYGMHRSKWIQHFKLMDYDEFMDYYKDVDGVTPEFQKIRPVYCDPTIYSMAIRHFMRMQFTTPPSMDDNSFKRTQSVFKSSLFKYKVFVVEHFDKPHPDKWPLGRRVVVANGSCTHITKPDYSTNKLNGWHPFVEAQWLSSPPNSIAAGPMNDVIRKNKEINLKDSLVATAVRRNMGSQLLVKIGGGLEVEQITGEPGKTHLVNDPSTTARWLHDEMPIPPVIARLRELDKEDVYESSGAIEALRGEGSTGATSGYQEKQREEREEKRLTPARRAFGGFVEGIGEKITTCLRQNVLKLDDSVMGFLKRNGAGEFSEQDVIAFISSSIDFGIDIKIDMSSMAIRSKASDQALMRELGQDPAVANRLQTDAKVLDEYLKFFDAETLRDDSSVHRDRATRENEVFMDMIRLGPNIEGIPHPIVLEEDDDILHMAEHDLCLVKNFEEFRSNPQMLFQFLEHKNRHDLQNQAKMAKLQPGASTQTGKMMQQAQMQAPPTVETIMVDKMKRQLSEQSMNADINSEESPPQAPRQPSSEGSTSGTMDASAPSANTPSAASKGGV